MLDQANQLLEAFQGQDDQWNQPFPMGVFGTLRKGCCNDALMGGDHMALRLHPPEYHSHHRAFMPHFVASGLSIYHSPASSAVFEVFTYTPENWAKMIHSVDCLEGFHPDRDRDHDWGYQRTLAWLHILPDDYDSPFWADDVWGSGERDLKIPVEEWSQYARVPCWVYSSMRQNRLSQELEDSPIIWCG